MKKIYFATGSRADYGIVRRYLKLLQEDTEIDLAILVTGALLNADFGHQVDLIYQDGFRVAAEVDIQIDPSSNQGVVHSMALALDRFGAYFQSDKPDLLIILGDRYEMLSVATAAAMNRIPILHIHGGEATFGNYDEFLRHAITKMSLFHFTATEIFRNRVIQLGESPERVYNLGALGAENCLQIDEAKVPNWVMQLKGKPYFAVLFHPETLTNIRVEVQVEELLQAIAAFSHLTFVFLGANADTNSHIIRERIRSFAELNANCLYYENLPTAGYHYLLKNSSGLIGNSSSGLIEAPSLGTYTINIGDRQEGRVRGNSVFDIGCTKPEIISAIEKVCSLDKTEVIYNPYYKKNTARNYYLKTKEILSFIEGGGNDHPKRFYDIQVEK